MIQIVKDFTRFANNIDKYIEKSNYKTKYFIENLDISKPTFYRKIKETSFTVSELNILAELIFAQEYYEWKIKQSIENSREEVLQGKFTTAREDLEGLRKKYQNQ